MSLLENLHLSPEERLLLICARLHLSQGQREELAGLVAGPIDWELLLHKAKWQGLTPLVYHHLRREDSTGTILPATMVQFKQSYLGNAAQNLDFEAELWRVVNHLQQAGIPVVLLKGAGLLHTVYPNVELRPMSDLDLLVPQDQVYRAQSLVIGLGYRAVGSPLAQEETEKNHRHLPGLLRTHRPILVEIHRHVVRKDSRAFFDIEDFWSRARVHHFDKGSALVLAPEDMLIHLCINFLLDRQFKSVGSLRQLCDISESIRNYLDVVDWQFLSSQVFKLGVNGPVSCSLFLAQQLLEAPVPDDVVMRIAPVDLRSSEINLLVRQRILGEQWVAKGLSHSNANWQWPSMSLSVLRRLLPSRHYLEVHYNVPSHSMRFWLLYLKRLGQALSLAGKYATRPRAITQDIAVDRWLNSLYSYTDST